MPDIKANCACPICTIKTSEKYYFLEWTEWSEQSADSNPDMKGIYSLNVEECSNDKISGDNNDRIAGINCPSNTTDLQNINTIFDALYDENLDKIKEILSHNLLNNSDTENNLEKLFKRYDLSCCYTAIWNVNNTLCIKLRSYDVFICMHYDNKQTDKISSIRVFNFKDADEDSVSEYDFDKDAPGVYLPDFLGTDGKIHDEPVRDE